RAPAAVCAAAPAPPATARLLLSILAHFLQQKPFAQAAISDADTLARPGALDGLQNSGPGQDQIGAIRPDAAFRRPSCGAERDQAVGRFFAVAARHPQAVDQIALITPQPKMNPGQTGDGARGADHMAAPRLDTGQDVRARPARGAGRAEVGRSEER